MTFFNGLNKKYETIVIDPPWEYQLRNKDSTHRNKISYQSMGDNDIFSLPMHDVANPKGSILWLWFTNNHVATAVRCLEICGYSQKTILTWSKITKEGKPRLGVGHWLRNTTEHCFLATKGYVKSFRYQRTLTNQPTILFAKRREHSRKPKEFYQLVKELTPSTSRIDLFSRESHEGFDSWGKEKDKFN